MVSGNCAINTLDRHYLPTVILAFNVTILVVSKHDPFYFLSFLDQIKDKPPPYPLIFFYRGTAQGTKTLSMLSTNVLFLFNWGCYGPG